MVSLFDTVGSRLRDTLRKQAQNGAVTIDIHPWAARTVLEMLAQGAFGTSFDTLEGGSDNSYFRTARGFQPIVYALAPYRPLFYVITELLPARFVTGILSLLPFKATQDLLAIREIMRQESLRVVQANRDMVDAERSGEKAAKEEVSIRAKENLFASLLRSYPPGSKDISDSTLIAQMNFLISASMDTTASAVAHTLQLLAEHPDAQNRLRAEVQEALSVSDAIDYDILSGLPYLDAVCRETLRLHSPVQVTNRMALIDTVLNLGRPLVGRDGKPITEIFIPRGTRLGIGVGFTNVDADIWGEDCLEWNPDRWLNDKMPPSVEDAKIPGIYSKLMTFWAGSRACLGFNFSQFEMKTLLARVVSGVEFTPAQAKVEWKMSGVIYPTVNGEHGLPIEIKAIED